VPGLLHQYSEIKVQLSRKISIAHLFFCLFPGGSITGAPKVSTMKILNDIEKRERGFYTGSTAIFYRDFKAASINIRSSEVDFKNHELLYQAGGGITLKSSDEDEFLEMSYKLNSFLSALTL
jgi:anthranilate/para-aminobenzoate synthase component I